MAEQSSERKTTYDGLPLSAEGLERFVLDTARDDIPSSEAKARLLASTDALLGDVHESAGRRWLSGRAGQFVGLTLLAGGALVAALVRSNAASSSETRFLVAPVSTHAALTEPSPEESPAPMRRALDVPMASPEPAATSSDRPASARSPERRGSSATARATAQGTRSTSTNERSRSTLDREIARITAVRGELAAGAPERALAELAAYESEFPTGAFKVEVVVLRIEALVRSGRTAEAHRLGERFLAQRPHGASARRVRLTLNSTAPPDDDRSPSD